MKPYVALTVKPSAVVEEVPRVRTRSMNGGEYFTQAKLDFRRWNEGSPEALDIPLLQGKRAKAAEALIRELEVDESSSAARGASARAHTPAFTRGKDGEIVYEPASDGSKGVVSRADR
ncbi:hypothetical protein PUNSTDRAFT_45115 [Punctularia strigosozonata HHB-11173 SS5]|uniref:uncharacterized protein n=1 Tax=Punctularia strigosozonata (strain HHB-11173) TaxID=741275 RepID=UPI0004417CBC|nr:uncharacterized protein PUNSTDRAFT_45115 [Punctularia strigosozonata HHB-11173 SS5]EIN08688.1 hypothetical protein PUNSTDRAFT_45115 [Punctularia strigosozonata HHB-11173 SS5]